MAVDPVAWAPRGEERSARHDRLARNLLLQAELHAIARVFNGCQLPFVVLKGIPLTLRLHGKLEAREMLDIDLLVHRNDVLAAAAQLRQLDYQHCPLHTIEGDLRSDFQSVLFRDLAHGFRLWVELHWSAFPPDMFDVPEALQWSHTEPFEVGAGQALVFDETMTLLHLAAHFAQHALSEPWILRDFAAAYNRWHASISPERLDVLATSCGLKHVFDFSLRAAFDLGWISGGPVPPVTRRTATVRRLLPSHRLLDAEYSRYARTLHTACLLKPRFAFSWLLRNAAPPVDRMSAIYGQPVGPRLYLRYLTRPARGVLRVIRKQHLARPRA